MTARATAARLARPADLERVSRAVAALDVVLVPESYFRLFGYQPNWSPGQRLATMDNGSGDEYQIVFQDDAAVVRVFDHESDLSPWTNPNGELAAGLLDGFPTRLRPIIDEPAFRSGVGPAVELTFCAWWVPQEGRWASGTTATDGGASELLEVVLDPRPSSYCKYATNYLEVDVDPQAVEAFYDLRPTTPFALRALNPDVDLSVAFAELRAMDYPIA